MKFNQSQLLKILTCFICSSFIIILASCGNDRLKVIQTTCNHQFECYMLANDVPLFGWQIESLEKDITQSAYSIMLYENNNTNENLVWESGRIESSQNREVEYNGEYRFADNKRYHWKVKVWDNNGNESRWSKDNYINIIPADLEKKAKWIGAIDIKDSNIPEGRSYHGLDISSENGKKWQQTNPLSKRSIYLRKDFANKKRVKNAIIYISGLGHYELSLNGEKVGDAQFSPMWSDYDKTVYFNAFDVTKLLKSKNAIGVLLGNGFFNEQGGRYVKMQVSFGPPTLFFSMHIEYNDGTSEEIKSDNTWKYDLSPITFNDMYGGEDYDAQLEQKGWDMFGFDDSKWQPVVLQSKPIGKMLYQTSDPIKIMNSFSIKSTNRSGDSYVFDMGQNLSGFPSISIKGNKGDKVKITVGERINEDGLINQSQSGGPYYYEYTLKGNGLETWQPRFTYYGYRYIQIDGAKPKDAKDERDIPTLEQLESHFVHNSAESVGEFECSNEIFNKTHQLIVNAIKSNMHAVFTDCPHREKLGWLEQIHLNGPGLFYNFDLTKFAPKIMQDIRDAQLSNGLVPDIAPEYVEFVDGFRDSPEWGSTSVFLPFMYYEYYGDKSLIVEYYDVMKKYVDYLSSTATDNIVSHGLGDWCDYRENEPYGVSHNTPVAISATVHYYMTIDYLIKASEIVNEKEDFVYYTNLLKEVKDSFNKEFFDLETKQYGTGSQASNSMPLFAGLVETEYKQDVLNNLIADIKNKNYRLTTGDVGNRYLFQTLANNGLNEIMYKMHNHIDVPGYGFQLQFGNTTLTELWNPNDGASWNHFMMGQIEEWFYKSLAGINTNDYSGFKNITIAPQPVGDLKYVKASYKTTHGEVAVNWEIVDSNFHLNVSIPHNTTAKVYLPGIDEYTTIGSGSHKFVSPLKSK